MNHSYLISELYAQLEFINSMSKNHEVDEFNENNGNTFNIPPRLHFLSKVYFLNQSTQSNEYIKEQSN